MLTMADAEEGGGDDGDGDDDDEGESIQLTNVTKKSDYI